MRCYYKLHNLFRLPGLLGLIQCGLDVEGFLTRVPAYDLHFGLIPRLGLESFRELGWDLWSWSWMRLEVGELVLRGGWLELETILWQLLELGMAN
jgi:hypothetical protein